LPPGQLNDQTIARFATGVKSETHPRIVLAVDELLPIYFRRGRLPFKNLEVWHTFSMVFKVIMLFLNNGLKIHDKKVKFNRVLLEKY